MSQKKAKGYKQKRRLTAVRHERVPSRPPTVLDQVLDGARAFRDERESQNTAPAEKQEWQRLPLVEEVVRELIKAHHHHLERATIVVLGKPTASVSGGKTNVAKAKRATPALNALVKDEIGEIHYLIEIGQDAWDTLDQTKRRIVLDHELMHFSGLDDETGKWGLVRHDVECFTEEIRRYGAWNEDLRGFVAAIKQLSLFKE